jgi:hypothetical protein
MTLAVRHRIVANAFGNDKNLPFIQLNGSLLELNAQMSSQDKKEFVLVSMTVPGELSVNLRHFHVGIVNLSDNPRRPQLLQARDSLL